MADIQSRTVWSLASGKLIDECDVGDVPDKMLHRPFPHADGIRVELVLKKHWPCMKESDQMYQKYSGKLGYAKRQPAEGSWARH